MAIRLDKAFGGGAGTWYRLQAAYDLAPGNEASGRHSSRAADRGAVDRMAPARAPPQRKVVCPPLRAQCGGQRESRAAPGQRVKVFDFFAGCGGASRGFQDAGMDSRRPAIPSRHASQWR